VPLINCRAGTVENLPAEAGRALPIPALQKRIRHLICEMLKAAKLTGKEKENRTCQKDKIRRKKPKRNHPKPQKKRNWLSWKKRKINNPSFH
jgi:hypothetical protein